MGSVPRHHPLHTVSTPATLLPPFVAALHIVVVVAALLLLFRVSCPPHARQDRRSPPQGRPETTTPLQTCAVPTGFLPPSWLSISVSLGGSCCLFPWRTRLRSCATSSTLRSGVKSMVEDVRAPRILCRCPPPSLDTCYGSSLARLGGPLLVTCAVWFMDVVLFFFFFQPLLCCVLLH